MVNIVRGDIFGVSPPWCHIAFATNTEGVNDAGFGFAGQVARNHWPELVNTGSHQLGEVLIHQAASGIVFYALVCHSLAGDGWSKTPEVITECLNKIDLRPTRENDVSRPIPLCGLDIDSTTTIPAFLNELDEGSTIAMVLPGAGAIGRMLGANVLANLGGIARSRSRVAVYTL